jgi:outer membrane protein TolC
MRTLPPLVAIACLAPMLAAAQQAAAGPAQTQAAPLPLSGRAPQAGSVAAVEGASTAAGINTLNPGVSVSGEFAGSTRGLRPFTGRLSLADAIGRGLAYNLGANQWSNTVLQSEGQSQVARSALLPDLSGSFTDTEEQLDLKAQGIRINTPLAGPLAGFSFPSVVGPFNYTQLQATLAQSLVNFTAIHNYHAAQDTVRAQRLELRDARDLVVLGVGGAYLGVIAAQARLNAARAQLATANAILLQSQQKQSVGTVPVLTVDQNQVQAAIQQLQLTTLRNDLAKQKINLARMIGLPPSADYTLSNAVPYAPPPSLTLQAALARALEQRADLQAAAAQAEAAKAALAAARDERLPSASVSGSYGVIGAAPWSSSHGVFTVVGTLSVPLWQGGRVGGEVRQANAALHQRQAELEDMRAQIVAQVREAFLDLGAAASEVQVARANLKVSREALQMTRDRFQAGVINTVELIQSQQAVATAEQDWINSVYADNVAKLTLARALGDAQASWPKYLPVAH